MVLIHHLPAPRLLKVSLPAKVWSLKIGGLAHSFPPFFVLAGNIFCTGQPNSILHNQKEDRQATNSFQFLTPWKSPPTPPPHDCKNQISFHWQWWINSLIGNCQCMYYLIVRALTISNFGFSCSFGCSYRKTLFSERLSTMTTMITSSCLLCLLFHNTVMVPCYCQGNCHYALLLPCTFLPYAPGGEGREMTITNNNYPRGYDNVKNVRPHPTNTQQSAIGKGGGGGSNKDNKEGDCDGCCRIMGKAKAALEKRRRVG
jgi:hypothetical protein